MKVHLINIPMSAKGAVTVEGETEDAHKGVWFCDPALHQPVRGDVVVFANNQEVYATGYVVAANTPTQSKYCSGVNTWGFYWREFTPNIILKNVDTGAELQ